MLPSGAVFSCASTNIGPVGASKSDNRGGRNLYLIGAGASPFFLCFVTGPLKSGVDLALLSDGSGPFDSLFLSDSFFALEARSRANGASSPGFEDLKSGFNGEDIAGWWSSSRARF